MSVGSARPEGEARTTEKQIGTLHPKSNANLARECFSALLLGRYPHRPPRPPPPHDHAFPSISALQRAARHPAAAPRRRAADPDPGRGDGALTLRGHRRKRCRLPGRQHHVWQPAQQQPQGHGGSRHGLYTGIPLRLRRDLPGRHHRLCAEHAGGHARCLGRRQHLVPRRQRSARHPHPRARTLREHRRRFF